MFGYGLFAFGLVLGGATGMSDAEGISTTLVSSLFTFVGGTLLGFAGFHRSLKKGGQENVAHLKTLKGDAFDKAYIEHEIVYHQQVIDAMDKTLIPSASNAELKALLVKVRPAFVAHLEHAKQVQDELGK